MIAEKDSISPDFRCPVCDKGLADGDRYIQENITEVVMCPFCHASFLVAMKRCYEVSNFDNPKN